MKYNQPPSPLCRYGRSLRGWITGLLCALPFLTSKAAEAVADGKPTNLADLSIEQLMNESVTSVSKKEQKLGDAPAAISVLTNDDLRRSGVTTVADALRLVPGVQVAMIDSGTWAVSARGFNSQFGNKLLVMIDGRTTYSPLFSGVYWDAQQVMIEDVDRIEVIRGPGATIWGANAVNGVINIVSKSARDTQGGLTYAGGGDVHLALGGARYGGKINETTFYRVYGTYQLNENYQTANGQSANDKWDLGKGGFRIDKYTEADAQGTWQGDAYGGNLADYTGSQFGFNTLGRWSRRISERSSYEAQAYLDHTYRNDSLVEIALDTLDLSFQHTLGIGERNDLIWGLGYRFINTDPIKANSPGLTLQGESFGLNLFSGFIQDEIKIVPDKVIFTLGTKLEHNDFSGLEIQPSARFVLKPTENQTIWAAVSQADRTPSAVEGRNLITFALGAPVVGPGGGLYAPTFDGNPEFGSEDLTAYEFGYRIQPTRRISVDTAAFYNDYSNLYGRQVVGFAPGAPIGILKFQPENTIHGESYGIETSLTVAVLDNWRMSASYSLLIMSMHGTPVSDAESLELNAPTHQVVWRSSFDLTPQVSLDGQVRYVDNVQGIKSYVTADFRLSYHPTEKLEIALVGQNLLDNSHPEQASPIGLPSVEVPRGVYGKITWSF